MYLGLGGTYVPRSVRYKCVFLKEVHMYLQKKDTFVVVYFPDKKYAFSRQISAFFNFFDFFQLIDRIYCRFPRSCTVSVWLL